MRSPGPIQALTSYIMPRRVLYRLHRREHILIPRHSDQVRHEVHQISMLALDAKSEIRRLTEEGMRSRSRSHTPDIAERPRRSIF
jgi:hypothetical protein